MTPMVHWPETMMTHCKGEVSYLFTGDAFGCFGALNGGLIDKDIDTDWCWLEMVRYYSNIVGKYGTPVQNALKKLAGIHIDYICSTHGPRMGISMLTRLSDCMTVCLSTKQSLVW